ncbi:hypothetical protein C5B72_03300 [Acinetobacter sp. KU 011TH]|uniref:hypothetical protein n=1 Tax=Acinetobacter TaxID=469 RepID=UPI000A3C0DA3|nr:hypothetical protein [Acinetobacter]NUF33426.1 hypothetical protein [Acinetobacter oleivorans]OTU47263.1 hypothetical protein CAT37_01775 [Acinetobacter pittii]TDM66546.1 hypothetical protein C5B72_03300 [Acinetobacter sp. KU 011TH]TDM67381.1 hypothetical protein C4608_03300 [Acinetobacter sp. KU 013TH]
MKKILLFILSLSAYSIANAGFNILNTPEVISVGRCHMGYCSWSKSISTKIISETSKNVLLEATLLGGTSEFDPEDSRGGDQDIRWDKKPHKLIINCSYTKPSVGSGSQLTILDFSSADGMPAVYDSDISVYFKYCHSYTDNGDAPKEFGYIN